MAYRVEDAAEIQSNESPVFGLTIYVNSDADDRLHRDTLTFFSKKSSDYLRKQVLARVNLPLMGIDFSVPFT